METGLTEWLYGHRDHALLLIPLIAFAEACPGIGLFVSGVILVTVASLMLAEQWVSLEHVLLLAFLGAFSADHVGFYLGRRAGPAWHHSPFAARHAERVAKADRLVGRLGWGAVLIGRFIPAIRSVIPLVTGLSGYAPLRFTAADLVACTLWTTGLGVILAGVARFTA